MRKYGSHDAEILFRYHVGSGTFHGREFELSVTATPGGDIAGMPVVEVGDVMVAFEMEDVVPAAFDFAGIGSDEDGSRVP